MEKQSFNPIKACNKKAWQSIQNIQNASNMIEVEDRINDAILDTFGLRHLGLQKLKLKNDNSKFDAMVARKYFNMATYQKCTKQYLMQFIPARFHKTNLYKQFIAASLI